MYSIYVNLNEVTNACIFSFYSNVNPILQISVDYTRWLKICNATISNLTNKQSS